VLLAVSDIYTEDQPFIQQMELLINNFTAWGNNTAENYTENVELCDQQYEHNINRHYIVTKYFVEDIKNVRIKDRCVCLINIYTFLHRYYILHICIFFYTIL